MTRIPRFYLVLAVVAVLGLSSVPFASARPLDTSQASHRSDSGWFETALRWLEDLTGFHRSTAGQAPALPEPAQKESVPPTPTGNSCIDPYGHPRPWCL